MILSESNSAHDWVREIEGGEREIEGERDK